MGEPLLSVTDLRTTFDTDEGTVRAVEGVSFDIHEGETVGLVGESGSGKTVTARSLVGLAEEGSVSGSVRFRGEELLGRSESALHEVRGDGIGMVFQDSLASLNPVYTVGNQIREALRHQRGLRGKASREEAVSLLEAVGIPDAPRRLDAYPHELSGGQRQRALIAAALACEPDVLICDEPTTGLDVSTQANLLTLLEEIQDERGLAMLFITHDLGVVAQTADRVNVMYAGEIVESAPVGALFDDPAHPYTRGLLASVPSATDRTDLDSIPGEVPTATERATHCRFAPRCPDATEECEAVHPEHVAVGEGHEAACLHYPKSLDRTETAERHAQSDPKGDSPEVRR